MLRSAPWRRLWQLLFSLLLVVSLPLSAMLGAAPAHAAQFDSSETLAPSDAPRLPAQGVPLPRVPASFNNYDGDWITFAYPPEVRERVQPLISQANGFRHTLSNMLGKPVLLARDGQPRVHIRIARTPGEMASLAPEGHPPPKYAGGVAYSRIGLVLLTIEPVHPNSIHDLPEVFRHELAHVAIFDAVNGHPIPRWFNEGFAVYASGESSLPRLQTLWSATVSENLIPFERLERSFPKDSLEVSIAYAQSADIVRYLMRTQDQQRFESLIGRVGKGQSFERALENSYSTSLDMLEYEWREDVAKRYTMWPVLFSGSFVWVGAIGLFVVAWRRKRRRQAAILARWEKEEAEEDRQRELAMKEAVRVHIVVPRESQPGSWGELRKDGDDELPASAERFFERLRPATTGDEPPPPSQSSEKDVPKVRVDGTWHTLH